MKWYIIDSEGSPLYYDAMLLEFDTQEAAQRFIDSDTLDAPFYDDVTIKLMNFGSEDDVRFNATNYIIRNGEMEKI